MSAPPPRGALITEREALERYDASLAAVNDQDGTRLAATYALDATAMVVGAGSVATGGAGALESFFRPLWRGVSDARATRQLALVYQNTVVVIAWLRGTHDGPFRGHDASGRPIGLLVCRVLELNASGKIQRDLHYQDPATILGQIGAHARPHRPALASCAAPEVLLAGSSAAEAAQLAIAARFEQEVVDGAIDAAVAMLASEAVLSVNFLPDDSRGDREIAEQLRLWLRSFTKPRVDVVTRMLVSRFVISRLTITGAWMDNPVVAESIVLVEFDGARIARVMVFANGLALWGQISA